MRTMGRQNWLALLGLMALALQFIAGFAHHHAHAGSALHAHHAGEAVAASASEALSPGCDHAGESDGAPAGDGDGGDEHACDICLALTALRTAQLPAASVVLPPTTSAQVFDAVLEGPAPLRPWLRAHGARAPPYSRFA